MGFSSADSRRSGRPPTTRANQQALVDAVPLPAALLDRSGRIRALNAAWEEAARPGAMVAPTDHVGTDYVHDLRDGKGFHQATGRRLADLLGGILKAEGLRAPEHMEYSIGPPEQQQHWSMQAATVDVDGDIEILVTHAEETARTTKSDLEDRVQHLMVEREHASAVASDRTRLLLAAEQSFHAPLTPIRLQLHLLQSGALGEMNPKQKGAIERIDRNVRRWWNLQEHLVTDLTGLERADAEAEAADGGELFDEALQPFQERAIKAGIKLRIDRGDDPMPVKVERRAVVQVMMYALDHAVRETPSGGLVWIHLRPADGHMELVIQDQDPDMDPERAHALLEDGDERSGELRSGLLHSFAVLERHGGQLKVDCHGPGRGLELTLRFPLHSSSGNVGASAPEEISH